MAVDILRGGVLPKLKDILLDGISHRVEDDRLDAWDKGVFLNELLRQGIALSTNDSGAIDGGIVAKKGLTKGTYHGTRLALTEIYNMIEEAATSHFNAKGFELIIPTIRSLREKQDTYQWSQPSADGYPPHLETVPFDQQDALHGNVFNGLIFNLPHQLYVGAIAAVFSFVIPDSISILGTPFEGPTLADCEKYNREHKSANTDIMEGENIGFKADWYSDARFAQQHFSGVNPTTIEAATASRIQEFANEAGKQGSEDIQKILLEGKDIFMQDYAYFREATGLSNEEIFQNSVPELDGGRNPTGKVALRYLCAPIVMFQLHSDGRLHPLAITLDYKGGMDKSITIFNKRATPDAVGPIDEKDDWPWRFAKTCAQAADWTRHEIAVHLVDTHLIEEAIIVATQRTIPDGHIIQEILSPHWFRTLPLNAAARTSLVPAVVARASGLGPTTNPTTSRAMSFLRWSYANFDFQAKYIPNDLKKRGFDIEADDAGDKFRNYPYATDMHLLWGVIRDFVKAVLETKYKSDGDVVADEYIKPWCAEIQGPGQIPTFPSITTVEQLIDAVTMCIHTASPQHTAVNYLQDYYYSFVPSKPPALCAPLPSSLAALQQYSEAELTAALPIGSSSAQWKDWLLAAQLPELLSYKVDTKYSLITYAKSLYNVNKKRTAFENASFDYAAVKDAAAMLYSRLKVLEGVFEKVSEAQTEGSIEYLVLQPEVTAVSILI